MDEYRNGGAQLADTLSGANSVNDNGGTYGQVDVLELEDPKPENFGLPASAARSRDGGPSLLERKLAIALERTCEQNPCACILRFAVPGLPDRAADARGRERLDGPSRPEGRPRARARLHGARGDHVHRPQPGVRGPERRRRRRAASRTS